MDDNNELNLVLNKKINFFYKEKTLIHIKVKDSGTFYNGFINKISADFFMFEDRRLGLIPVFLLEIDRIEPYINEDNNET